MDFFETDGGRVLAGFLPENAADCVVRAITIVTHDFYSKVHAEVANFCLENKFVSRRKKAGKFIDKAGVASSLVRKFLKQKGFLWVPTCKFGGRDRQKLDDTLPFGKLIVSTYGHVAAVVDRVLYDNEDRRGACVYGYWALF